MQLKVAREDDSARLAEFFSRQILPGALDLSVRRKGSFFAQYRLQSDDFETLILEDDDGSIQGIATLVFIDGILNGERQTFGYATDLRIAPTRKAVMQWGQHFLPLLEHALQTRQCKYVFSAIERADNQATNALIRPQQVRRRLPRYYLLRRFHMVGIHGKIPFGRRRLSGIRVERLEMNGLSELCYYLHSKAHDRPIAFLNDEENFLKRIARFPGMKLEDVRVAKDVRGNILGCTAPWKSGAVQDLIPTKYNGFASTVQQLIRIAGTLRLVRPLPAIDEPLNATFLTMLNADSPEAFFSMTEDVLSSTQREILLYAHFRGNLVTLPSRSYIVSALPYALYTLVPPDSTVPDFLQPDAWRPPPEFEPCML